ncbi:MAG TPA: FAD-binding oxidoreductase [Solirubrobacteraceae bacterium]|nr:FAD-binding oxidoreductase [Solirubrobacteraceae bacterium]
MQPQCQIESQPVEPFEPRDGARAAARRLERLVTGAVHVPGAAGYDAARRTLDPAFDSRPAVVVEAAGAADVRTALVIAREHDLPLAVQATGHGTRVPCDGGVLIRTSRIATVLVDPDRRVARVGPGARWGAVLAAAAPFGLAPLSGSSPDVGVAGYTLGGGLGWLARRHGFAADSLLRAEVVTAEGALVTASPAEHPDLLWALRGGGGNFGLVTAMEIALHPVTEVYAGTVLFPADRAAETLARYRDWAQDVPDALSTALLVTTMADAPEVPETVRGRRVLALKAMHAGRPEEAERLLAPLRAVAGPALVDGLRPTRFADAAMGGTPPRRLDLFEDLPDPVVAAVAGAAAGTVEVRHWGGAMARPGADAGPVGHRATRFSVIADAADPTLVAAVAPHATGGSFLNFLGDPARVHTAYTPANWRRLRDAKRAYDPDNVFRVGPSIPPAEAPRRRVAGARLRW